MFEDGFAGQGLNGEHTLFIDHITLRVVLLRKGGGAGIDIGHAVFFLNGQHMGMPMDEQVAILMRRQVIQIKEMTMRDERGSSIKVKESIIRHDGELEHHLIDFGITVAADAEQLVFYVVEQGDNALRIVFVRQIIARAMIQQIASRTRRSPFSA